MTLQQQWQEKANSWQFEPESSDGLLQDEQEYRCMVSKDRTYVPPHMRPYLIKELHESPEYGHAGIEEMVRRLSKVFAIPHRDKLFTSLYWTTFLAKLGMKVHPIFYKKLLELAPQDAELAEDIELKNDEYMVEAVKDLRKIGQTNRLHSAFTEIQPAQRPVAVSTKQRRFFSSQREQR
ncbi:hypothetical protein COCHEDRAFT_29824 [Bipolaris maydis C5]|uniref:Integrase zinc-binding domain-containing protein n=1 Tax=Cochliobolus heterostrophus (strain C5 / ATCC 48332 / race O) TaxID=701091 RepID=M2V486_COCH5|nr:hypothetical protein COCHEDRAFT_29824 [Bipolaris maydis C5]